MAEITDADRAKARAMLKRYGLPQVEPYMEDEIARAIAEAREDGQRERDAKYFKSFEQHGGWTSLTSRAEAWLAVVDALDTVAPEWAILADGRSGVECAVDAIKAQRCAPPGCIVDDKGNVLHPPTPGSRPCWLNPGEPMPPLVLDADDYQTDPDEKGPTP